jgi:hypothetical protein
MLAAYVVEMFTTVLYRFKIVVRVFTYVTGPDRPRGIPSLLCNEYRVFIPGVKRPRRGVDHLSSLAPKLKKE